MSERDDIPTIPWQGNCETCDKPLTDNNKPHGSLRQGRVCLTCYMRAEYKAGRLDLPSEPHPWSRP